MNRLKLIISILFTATYSIMAQPVLNPEFDAKLVSLLDFTVDTIGVNVAFSQIDQYKWLDARELDEYKVSHIPGAIHAGYDHFDINKLSHLDKDQPILVYCSIGYRSEKIGQKLLEAGYTKVFNLYGSIFEWVNCELPIENEKGEPTTNIHTYNRSWSKWVDNKEINKVW